MSLRGSESPVSGHLMYCIISQILLLIFSDCPGERDPLDDRQETLGLGVDVGNDSVKDYVSDDSVNNTNNILPTDCCDHFLFFFQ